MQIVEFPESNNTAVVKPGTYLDRSNIEIFRRIVVDLVIRQGKKEVYVDFSDIKNLDYETMSELIALKNSYSESERRVKFFGLQPQVRQQLRISQVDKLLDICAIEDKLPRICGYNFASCGL